MAGGGGEQSPVCCRARYCPPPTYTHTHIRKCPFPPIFQREPVTRPVALCTVRGTGNPTRASVSFPWRNSERIQPIHGRVLLASRRFFASSNWDFCPVALRYAAMPDFPKKLCGELGTASGVGLLFFPLYRPFIHSQHRKNGSPMILQLQFAHLFFGLCMLRKPPLPLPS